MTISDFLTAWGRWARGGVKFRKFNENILYRLMTGSVQGKSTSQPLLPVDLNLGNKTPDEFFTGVECAIAKLPKRQREAVMLAYLQEPDLTHEERSLLMRPPCTRVTYTRHLNSALEQLSIDLGCDF